MYQSNTSKMPPKYKLELPNLVPYQQLGDFMRANISLRLQELVNIICLGIRILRRYQKHSLTWAIMIK